jgi:hypothetical protein
MINNIAYERVARSILGSLSSDGTEAFTEPTHNYPQRLSEK